MNMSLKQTEETEDKGIQHVQTIGGQREFCLCLNSLIYCHVKELGKSDVDMTS